MSKPVKVWFTGVLPMVDGSPLSRVQSFTMDPDLNFTEMYELGNASIVQYDRDTPSVTTTINTNDYASIMNLRKLTGIKTGDITMSALEGKSVSITALVEQDQVLKRTICSAGTYLSSISWNYDVGGVGSENFTLSSTNKSIYTQAYRQLIAVPVTWLNSEAATASGYIASGAGLLTSGSTDKYTWDEGTNIAYNLSGYTPLYIWNGTWKSSVITDAFTESGNLAQDTKVLWSGENTLDSGTRIFCLCYKTLDILADLEGSATNGFDTESGIATVRKGQVLVEIAPDGGAGTYEQWFRVQTIGIDTDLARTPLDELGNYYPFYESLPDPIISTVNITMLDSDVEAFYHAAGLAWTEGGAAYKEIDIEDFSRQAAIRVKVFTSKDRSPSELGKTIILDTIQVTSESFSADVQDSARQTMQATTSSLTITGADLS